jgi:hypothetical protein
VRPRLVRKAAAASPPKTALDHAHELARYWEHCTNILATQAIEVQAAWLEVLALCEARGVLVVGQTIAPSVARMDSAVRALSKGPGK